MTSISSDTIHHIDTDAALPSISQILHDALLARGWKFDETVKENESGEVCAYSHEEVFGTMPLIDAFWRQETLDFTRSQD